MLTTSSHIKASADEVREDVGIALNHCLQRATAGQSTRQENVAAPHESESQLTLEHSSDNFFRHQAIGQANDSDVASDLALAVDHNVVTTKAE
jgi:hypothetical protein